MGKSADTGRIRERAISLLGLALRAQERGNVEVAKDLALLASESFDKIEEIKNRPMAGARLP